MTVVPRGVGGTVGAAAVGVLIAARVGAADLHHGHPGQRLQKIRARVHNIHAE